MRKIVQVTLLTLLLSASAITVIAADDPKIPADTKEHVLTALKAHVQTVLSKNDGQYPVLDQATGRVVYLNLEKIHPGVVRKGRAGLFASCADFRHKDGTVYDLDFLVSENYEVAVSFVHKRNGKKMPYDVE